MNSLAVLSCVKENERVHMLDIGCIAPNKRQPRRDFEDSAMIALADSIKRHGIIQPLSVRKVTEGRFPYELIAGERRLRAAEMLKMEKVPCVILNADERTSAELSIVENIQRENLNIFEEAQAISTLIGLYRMTQEQIASSLSVSQSYIANKLRILRLDESERRKILDNSLTERHCRALLRLTDDESRSIALDHIIRYKLNVSQSEEYIERLLSAENHVEKAKVVNPKLKDIRVFYNTIDRAVATVRNFGVDVETQVFEEEDHTKLTIIIPKL